VLFLALGLLAVVVIKVGLSWRMVGWYGGIALPLIGLVWGYIAYEARQDPRFAQAWLSELTLAERYD
jgi:type IV secretory pathway TrbD component